MVGSGDIGLKVKHRRAAETCTLCSQAQQELPIGAQLPQRCIPTFRVLVEAGRLRVVVVAVG